MNRNKNLWTLATAVLAATFLSGCDSIPRSQGTIYLDDATRDKAVEVLREGLHADDFWPSIHAAEGLTLGGHGDEVRAYLEPKLATDHDDQHRCGISRELVRAGDKSKVAVMAGILRGSDDYGHIHAAESLYKVYEVGDPKAMRRAFEQDENIKLELMAAAALARHGDLDAIVVIRENLNSDDDEALRISAWILGRIGNQDDIEPMRARLPGVTDPVLKAYLEHSMAALGDPEGLAALGRNLSSSDGAIRTYAATFAGDAKAAQFAPKLKKMLDDPHPDARYRAAQTLLVLDGEKG